MTKRIAATILIAGLTVPAVGCAGNSDRYPSLSVRESERFRGELSPATPDRTPVEYRTDANLIAGALEQAQAANSQFSAQKSATLELIRTAALDGDANDGRSRALIAIAELTILRGKTASALADLDQAEADGAVAFASLDEVRAAQEQIAQLIAVQDAVLDNLSKDVNW